MLKLMVQQKKYQLKYLRKNKNTSNRYQEKYIRSTNDNITRKVRKDNTILYLSNRYTVPLGTYEPGKEVYLRTSDTIIQIIDKETGKIFNY